ncbi:nucleotidyltransferase family protein [Mycolicibacterium aubagnense]|nr:NTP transferase domain-containing protein [Mycolicibacterium aubagnense]WGI31186.1 NTP transferase domain-containing protein [Mycolicibacterium aubagnense]
MGPPDDPRVAGLLLAAGAGRRFGMPKALVPGAIERAVDALWSGGCTSVAVALGAGYERAAALVPDTASIIEVAGWEEGIAASLRAGLSAIDADAALIHFVDLPDVGPGVVARLRALANREQLARATYSGTPGHPVVIGRNHWTRVIAGARGDHGARDYLNSVGALDVPCEDLATGIDTDTPHGEWPTHRGAAR